MKLDKDKYCTLCLYAESEKKKRIHRYSEQCSRYQWGREGGMGKMEIED